MKKIFFATILIGLAIAFRTIIHVAPNVEYVTAASLLAGVYLGKKYAVLIPFIIMVLSDTLIGNTNIFIFTWSAYVSIGLIGQMGLMGKNKIILRATGTGILAGLFFFAWTNFGVWALDSWGMYPRTIGGLMQAYVMGLPFLKMTLLGNLLFVPVSFGIVEFVKNKFYMIVPSKKEEVYVG